MDETRKKLTFRGGMFFSLVPVVIYVFFCVVLFIIFKAFNMEALAVGGFIALLVGGLFCTSYSEFWDSAVRGISSITSVSVVVILLLTGMFSQLIKICGLSGGFVWLANSFGIRGGLFVAFTFLATCIVSTATGSSIGTMFIAFPIFYPAGLILGANPMWMAGCIVSGAVFGDNLAPISDTTIASSSTQQFHDGRPADIGGVVSSRVQYSAVAGLITIVFFAIVGGIGGTYQGGEIDAVSNPTTLVMLLPVVVMLVVSTKTRNIYAGIGVGLSLGTVVGLAAGLFTFADVFANDAANNAAVGFLIDGVNNILPTCALVISVFGIMGVLNDNDPVRWCYQCFDSDFWSHLEPHWLCQEHSSLPSCKPSGWYGKQPACYCAVYERVCIYRCCSDRTFPCRSGRRNSIRLCTVWHLPGCGHYRLGP